MNVAEILEKKKKKNHLIQVMRPEMDFTTFHIFYRKR